MKVSSVDAVRQALAEFDQSGRDQFLAKYKFGKALEWFVREGNEHYDSKAIYGAAHGFETGTFLVPADFSGGEATVVRQLKKLGFTVVKEHPDALPPKRNPPWTRDEVVLVLNAYVQWNGVPPGPKTEAIVGLSALLNQLNVKLGVAANATLRNPNGVVMKLMNFRSLDKASAARGSVGLANISQMDRDTWRDFEGQPDRLHQAAQAIRGWLDVEHLSLPQAGTLPEEPWMTEAMEGRIVSVQHFRRERSAELVKQKKASVLKAKGKLECEACGFDFASIYGARGEGFIECHHTIPVSTLKEGGKTRLVDLALLCANCHRMVHARRDWLTMSALRALLEPVAN